MSSSKRKKSKKQEKKQVSFGSPSAGSDQPELSPAQRAILTLDHDEPSSAASPGNAKTDSAASTAAKGKKNASGASLHLSAFACFCI